MRRRRGEKVLSAVHANAGIRAAYQKRLRALVAEMAVSYHHWILAAYRRVPPKMAQDASYGAKQKARTGLASREMERELKKLGARWEREFDDAAHRMAGWFAKSTMARTDGALRSILRKGGFSVEFQMTAAMRDVLNATVAENVSLIKSIPAQFHTQVEGMVMRSVTAGRDLSELTKGLRERFGVTRSRAEFIALDQNNKATAALRRARETEMGIEEGVWLHSHAGKKKRPTHVKQNGKRFSIREGWYDPAVKRHIMPGELPRCRCTWKVVVKGFS